MPEFDLARLRNIGIAAHIDAGKTTTTERILFYTGRVHRIGEVDEGTATTDWMVQEQERGITITSAVTFCEWKGYYINIIDTPGHVDFTVEVERSLRVLDGAAVVFCGVGGVEPQSETVWRQCDRYTVPRVAYINKLDRVGADFFGVVEQMKERLGAKPAIVNYPYFQGGAFTGIVDVLAQELVLYPDPQGVQLQRVPLPNSERERAAELRSRLIETVGEEDDEIMQKFVNEEPLTTEELIVGLRRATIASKLVPTFCGSSLRNKGVQLLLDGVVNFLPSPLDLMELKGKDPETQEEIILSRDVEAPFSALVFKVQTDAHVGRLSYVRVYSGRIKSGAHVYNANVGSRERISRILRMHANKREEIQELRAGDLAAVVGLKESTTGHTLCDENYPVVLETITFPEPVISLAVEPKNRQAQDKMGMALQKLAEEDPTFRRAVDPESGQTVISGMGELHLEILVDRLRREFGVEVQSGRPQVAYRETITGKARAEGRYVRQTGGRGQYGHVVIEVEPCESGSGNIFIDRIVGGAIPKDFIPAVQKGIQEAWDSGVLKGFPIVDVMVTLVDGSYHEVDSSEIAFKIAASKAFKEAARMAGVTLLEPIMKVEVVMPEEYVGDVVGDLNSRRGRIEDMQLLRGNTRIVRALVPLAELFGYATDLRSLTQGRATYTPQFARYQEVPRDRWDGLLGEQLVKSNA